MKAKDSGTRKTNGRRELDPRSRRFNDEQRQHALLLVASGGMSREAIAQAVGTTTQSLRRWVAMAAQKGAMPEPPAKKEPEREKQKNGIATSKARSPYAPSDPSQGLGEHEVCAILELKRRHPSMGPAQLRAQLKRFKGWRLSLKAIARVLRGHGYELVHRGKRPKGPEPVRFEAARRNALWQADFTEVRVGAERLHVLVVLDDFSRYVVGHALSEAPTSEVAAQTLQHAMARHGKPEAVRTDRGGAFVAFSRETDFGKFVERELIDHIVGKSYRPRGGGKVESAIGTLKRELWELEHFEDRATAQRRLCEFFEHYNERRAHMGIDGLTPADRFFGRADKVLGAIDAISRKREGAAALLDRPGQLVEETLSAQTGAPLEVLRLCLCDGVMELRFCGARVRLGRVES
jgi:transposase InsO family protein